MVAEFTPEEIADRVADAKEIAAELLPKNSTPIELSIMTAEIAVLLTYNPEIIKTIWNPWEIAAPLLPFLAWALSVDVWDPEWDEETMRTVIAASPEVHRLKGTRGAVERAVAAFEANVAITEWWEQEPIGARGTFNVTTIQENCGDVSPFGSAPLIEQAVRASKPKSRTAFFSNAISVPGDIYLGVGVAPHLGWTVAAAVFEDETINGQLHMGMAPTAQMNWAVSAEQ